MIGCHESFETDPGQRGRGFGIAQKSAVENTVASYERLFLETQGLSGKELRGQGRAVEQKLFRLNRALVDEVRGIAEGAGVDFLTLMAINARTELLAGSRASEECTVIGIIDDEQSILAQNWDWHPTANGSLVVWTIHDQAGGWFKTLTEAGILGKIGVNSAGLAVCLNILALTLDGGALQGLPIHLVLRLILSECTNVEEARSLIKSQQYSASTAITVADARGETSTLEVSPLGVSEVQNSGFTCHTNHFLTDVGASVDTIARDYPGSAERLSEVDRMLRSSGGVRADDIREALRSHLGRAATICSHELDGEIWADWQQTMASVIIHVRERMMEITDGPPCIAEYVQYRTQ